MDLPALPDGVTSVEAVHLYAAKARDGEPVEAPVTLVDERWVVDTLNVADGRWWATVQARKGDVAYAYPLRDPVDLPEDERLTISPESLAASIKMPLPLSDEDRDTLTQAILDAQSDVRAYLGRPVVPARYVEKGVWPYGAAWPLTVHGDDPVIRVLSVEPEVDAVLGVLDTYTVTYLAGINVRDDDEFEPIRRYLRAHAANSPEVTRLWRRAVNPEKVVKSASTSGQSVSYDVPTLGGGGAAGSGAPGALPSISSLDMWRVAGRRVHQGPTQFGTRYL